MDKILRLRLERRWKKAEYTIGILYVDGVRFCEVLEDAVRDHKIPGRTAIPAGTYQVNMGTVSPKFRLRAWAAKYNGIVPRLMNVPGYEGVLIHPGNSAADTEGCLLPGRNLEVGQVLWSQATYYRLMNQYLIPAKESETTIVIEIV